MKELIPVFLTVFFAELGDKTQLAALLFSAKGEVDRLGVFLAATAALTLSTLLAVAAGGFVSRWIPVQALQGVAGVGFIVIGAWTLWGLRG